MSDMEFVLPDVGEGLTEAEIVSWSVAPGDAVELNQAICEIETAKSIVELPSPFTGVISELLVSKGETVPVGTPIMRVKVDVGATDEGPTGSGNEQSSTATEAKASSDLGGNKDVADNKKDSSGSVLVGYGTGGEVKSRRRRGGEPLLDRAMVQPVGAGHVVAKPPIRKLAKDLGVDLGKVTGTGKVGEVLREDVVRSAEQVSVFRNLVTPELATDREERIPIKGVRKLTANAMVKSKFQAPHVSVFVDVDATRTMEYIKRLKSSTDFVGVKVSPLLMMAKAMIWAVRRNPGINATWSDTEIIRHNYVNLGIAAATPRGLIVPNIKDAQSLSLYQLAQAIEQLTNRAREGITQPEEMTDGTITITNIGVFGVDFGTPILNPGESAIMAMGTIKQKPWVVDGEVVPRFVTTIGGSFDHRVMDGDVMSRFVADVASVLEEPALLLD
ncbi:MAG TPA: dihydrolipoamide acetyltransferase family protein [Microbacteriaceae bacterium]|nr:dihydrolipoamide acetyltransferase family protein [Microbacteriaceae bacterium]